MGFPLDADKNRIIIDNGTGKARTPIFLGSLDLSPSRCSALIGLHAFTGNDYVSCFFRKGKDACWNVLEKYQKYESCFASLGSGATLSDEIFNQLQEYVCLLYSRKTKNVNEARWQLFKQKHEKENKIIDLESLPPCEAVLRLHTKRANAVAYLWRRAADPLVEFPPLEENGWMPDGQIFWIEDAFPDDIGDLLTDEIYDYEFGSDVESDSDDDLY